MHGHPLCLKVPIIADIDLILNIIISNLLLFIDSYNVETSITILVSWLTYKFPMGNVRLLFEVLPIGRLLVGLFCVSSEYKYTLFF